MLTFVKSSRMKMASLFPKSKTAILLEEITFLRAQVAQLQNYILLTQTPQATPTVAPTEDSDAYVRRLFMTEHEEDIEYAVREGLINSEAEAAELLRRAGAIDDEIEFS